MNLSEQFRTDMMKDNESAVVFLTNGVKLSGYITNVAPECMTLARDGVTQLIMMHAVATIMPGDANPIEKTYGEHAERRSRLRGGY